MVEGNFGRPHYYVLARIRKEVKGNHKRDRARQKAGWYTHPPPPPAAANQTPNPISRPTTTTDRLGSRHTRRHQRKPLPQQQPPTKPAWKTSTNRANNSTVTGRGPLGQSPLRASKIRWPQIPGTGRPCSPKPRPQCPRTIPMPTPSRPQAPTPPILQPLLTLTRQFRPGAH